MMSFVGTKVKVLIRNVVMNFALKVELDSKYLCHSFSALEDVNLVLAALIIAFQSLRGICLQVNN